MNFLKKISPVEKKALVQQYMAKGLNRDKSLKICQMSKHKFYYESRGKKPGRSSSQKTRLYESNAFRRRRTESATSGTKITVGRSVARQS